MRGIIHETALFAWKLQLVYVPRLLLAHMGIFHSGQYENTNSCNNHCNGDSDHTLSQQLAANYGSLTLSSINTDATSKECKQCRVTLTHTPILFILLSFNAKIHSKKNLDFLN